MGKVVNGRFGDKDTTIVLTCTMCGCQQFFLQLNPVAGTSATVAARCALCGEVGALYDNDSAEFGGGDGNE